MKKLIISLLAATSLAVGACSGSTDAPANNQAAAPAQSNNVQTASLPDADPAMWVVKDEDTTIYLFGTFHLLDGKTDWFNDEVKQAFDQAQEVVFEVPIPASEAEMMQAMQPLIMRYAIDQSGRRISADLTEEENRKLNAALAEIGAPAQAMDNFEPWFVSLSMTSVLAKRLGLDANSGAETIIQTAARGRNLPISGVETFESQMQVFDGLPREAQLVQLKETLENLDEMQGQLSQMLAVWNSGDAAGMERLMNEGMREDPALRRALLENRNRAWSEWIDQRLDRPGVVFMAVGAGHLVGHDSVQVFLKQRGIDSARVPQLTAGR
jgi:uncharacterized protein YbaP (TraB family)